MSKRSNEQGYIDIEVIGFLAVVLLVLGGIGLWIGFTVHWVNTKASQACHVTNKESVAKDKGHEYRVYTDNCGVFQVSDEAWLGKWNSADTYNMIQPGKTYALQTVGWRDGFWSQFPNIVEAAAK